MVTGEEQGSRAETIPAGFSRNEFCGNEECPDANCVRDTLAAKDTTIRVLQTNGQAGGGKEYL